MEEYKEMVKLVEPTKGFDRYLIKKFDGYRFLHGESFQTDIINYIYQLLSNPMTVGCVCSDYKANLPIETFLNIVKGMDDTIQYGSTIEYKVFEGSCSGFVKLEDYLIEHGPERVRSNQPIEDIYLIINQKDSSGKSVHHVFSTIADQEYSINSIYFFSHYYNEEYGHMHIEGTYEDAYYIEEYDNWYNDCYDVYKKPFKIYEAFEFGSFQFACNYIIHLWNNKMDYLAISNDIAKNLQHIMPMPEDSRRLEYRIYPKTMDRRYSLVPDKAAAGKRVNYMVIEQDEYYHVFLLIDNKGVSHV